VVSPPTIDVTRSPRAPTVGEPSVFVVRAEECRTGLARLTGPDGSLVQEWRFACPADPARLVWTPATEGDYALTVIARGEDSTSQTATSLTVREAE
jgi:hypothetical protein